MKKLVVLVLSMMLVLAMVGCTSEKQEDDSAVAIPEFEVTVVTADGEVAITNETIADLEVKNADILKTSQKGDSTSNWTGVSLVDALDAVGVTEFTSLSIEASDGYAVEYTVDMANAAWIAYACDGAELGEDGPVQTVVDGESGNNWMKNLTVITVQ